MNLNLQQLKEDANHPLTFKTISQGPCLYQSFHNGYFISIVPGETGYNVFLWNEFLGLIALVAFDVESEEVDSVIDDFYHKTQTLSMDDFLNLNAQGKE